MVHVLNTNANKETKETRRAAPSKGRSIAFNFETLKWEGITVAQVQFWESCYPDVDVVSVLTKKMPAWLDANPKKAHKTNWKRFITNWLSGQQERYEQFRRG